MRLGPWADSGMGGGLREGRWRPVHNRRRAAAKRAGPPELNAVTIADIDWEGFTSTPLRAVRPSRGPADLALENPEPSTGDTARIDGAVA